ncbi:LacI family DNA-binding transcriptional regulator [Cerasicoccus frondis]|uniref:LacI family DNA-binding transcriptional regulator n=1 Tax=Cerasicoccus frondis TaxID=490090 RepID=UPI002852648A|nr:LacI family DNA-binding transcriptional regulator [Cerasicoccus frondis]
MQDYSPIDFTILIVFMHSSRPTLRQIAQKCGVSAMTVSRALRNHPEIQMETRRRILREAEKMGYRPDPRVSSLMVQLKGGKQNQDVNTICYLTSYPTANKWRSYPFTVNAYNGAASRADQLGYRLEHLSLYDSGMTPQRASSILRARGVSGVIFAPLPEPGCIKIDLDYFAAASIGYSLIAPDLHRAVNDQYTSARIAYQQLLSSGYKRIGLAVSGESDERVERKWVAGYAAEREYHASRKLVPVCRPLRLERDVFSKWLLRHNIDAVMGLDDRIPDWIRAAGLKVPDDAGFAHLDCVDAVKSHSGIDQHPSAIGELAMDLVVEQILKNERGVPEAPKMVMNRGHWQSGSTTL